MKTVKEMYIYGDYALCKLFGVELPNHIDIVSTKPLSTSYIREALGLSNDKSLTVESVNTSTLNTDFWGITVDSDEPISFSEEHPISNNLYQVVPSNSLSESIRFLCIALKFPWDTITPSIKSEFLKIEDAADNDIELADLLSMKYGNKAYKELVHDIKEKNKVSPVLR